MEIEVRCEMCGSVMRPNMLSRFKMGKVVAVHVCSNCGIVIRDSDEKFLDMFHYDEPIADILDIDTWDEI